MSTRVFRGHIACRRSLFFRRYATESRAFAQKPSTFGQPLFESHPHLVQRNELTPGFTAEEYETRRRKLMDGLPESSIVVCVGGSIKYMSGMIFYRFRQASDFRYLTGFDEPDSAVVLEKTSRSPKGYRMTLFSAGRDPAKEKWDGARTTFEDSKALFDADDALSIEKFADHLKPLILRYSNVFADLPNTGRKAMSARSLLQYLTPSIAPRNPSDAVIDALRSSKPKPLAPKIARLRAIKSKAELDVMQQAAEISGRAHAKTMRFTRPGMSEGALAAHFEYICALAGSERPAYVPVVASGANALIIHYTSNNHLIDENDMLLIDAACEYNGYASDITRSFPASGTFSPPQRDLYTAVLTVQKALVKLCTESSGMSMHDIHNRTCSLLADELKQIGISPPARELEQVLFPHYVSHPIGLDLHESAHFDRFGGLKEGMVITIEPGIYIPPSSAYPSHFHNIGIRIEDEVVVGKEHPTVLTAAAPKEIEDVEGACQGLLGFEAY